MAFLFIDIAFDIAQAFGLIFVLVLLGYFSSINPNG